MRKVLYTVLLFLIAGCSPSNTQDCKREAKGITKSLTSDLRNVQTREDLIEKGDLIKQKSQALVSLIIRIKKLQEKKGDSSQEEDRSASDGLLAEMKRIYLIEGCRELMESFQREALLELDAAHQREKK